MLINQNKKNFPVGKEYETTRICRTDLERISLKISFLMMFETVE